MYKRNNTTLVVIVASISLFLICLMSEASAEVTASLRTNKAKYFLGEEISTWITLHVSEDVTTDADFFQKKVELQLDVRDPNKKRIIPTYYETNPGQNEPPPPPPVIPKIVLKAGDYEVVLEDLTEHYSISEIGPYTIRFVTSMTIYEPNPRAVEIASKIDTFEIVEAGLVAVDVVPGALSLRSKIKWITAFISAFPGTHTAADVNIDSVKLRHDEQYVSADWGVVQKDVLMVRFNGAEVQNMLSPAAEIELRVTGNFTDQKPFRGSDTIRVIEGGGGK
jgi:hypothetical protein